MKLENISNVFPDERHDYRANGALISIAVSLKRIADILDKETSVDLGRIATRLEEASLS